MTPNGDGHLPHARSDASFRRHSAGTRAPRIVVEIHFYFYTAYTHTCPRARPRRPRRKHTHWPEIFSSPTDNDLFVSSSCSCVDVFVYRRRRRRLRPRRVRLSFSDRRSSLGRRHTSHHNNTPSAPACCCVVTRTIYYDACICFVLLHVYRSFRHAVVHSCLLSCTSIIGVGRVTCDLRGEMVFTRR